jgi:hypothetical protein
MVLKEFTIGASHTLNLGNYESTRIEASVTFSVPEGDDFDACKAKAQQDLTKLLQETYTAQQRKNRRQ